MGASSLPASTPRPGRTGRDALASGPDAGPARVTPPRPTARSDTARVGVSADLAEGAPDG